LFRPRLLVCSAETALLGCNSASPLTHMIDHAPAALVQRAPETGVEQ
jgi:hypothetical protein